MASIGHPDHECGLTLVQRHNRVLGEEEPSPWAREAREDQSGHNRQERHAGEDFDGRDQMPIVGPRMHVAISHRCKGLDREI